MPYPNSLLTELCEIILEHDLSPDDILCLAADLPGEMQAHIDARDADPYGIHEERRRHP